MRQKFAAFACALLTGTPALAEGLVAAPGRPPITAPAVTSDSTAVAPAPSPGFDCQRASRPVEQWICADPGLAEADERLNGLYRIALAKPDGDSAVAQLRAQQLRWLRERNRCNSPQCVAAAYAQRGAALETANRRVLTLQGQRFEPVFSRVVPFVDDTRVLSGLRLQAAEATALQVELYTDARDARPWAHGGPGARIHCRPPDWREGYAARFEYAAHAQGDTFRGIERDGRAGYVLLRFTLGQDLPLDEDIRCTVALTEWLLEHPSQLHVVPAPN